MRALIANGYGPPSQLVLGEAPQPEPGPGQVLVRMRAAALNPFDLKLLSGAFGEGSKVQFPYIPGMDGAGFIAALGEGVEGLAVGEEVLGFFGRTPGTVAEYALLDAGPYLALRPEGLDPEHAAALGESGVTAKSLLRALGLEPASASATPAAAGKRLLVIGATGGIGMFAVQLARAAGAEVLATAGPAEREYVLGLGAAHALDYTAGDLVEQVQAIHPGGVDAMVDLVNSGEAIRESARALREGGHLASPLGGPSDLDRGVQVSYVSLTMQPGDLDDLAARAARGELRVEVSRSFPFERAVDAFVEFAEGHTRGKLVVTI
jgi:NADPH:quinone reductase-like Zn-dependent oxidoreductase